jgi:hypothetical protein
MFYNKVNGGYKMAGIQRQYDLLCDFYKVMKFLSDTYNIETLNGYLLPQFFEHSHFHPWFNYKYTHMIGLWEDKNELVGIACYEMDIGDCFISIKKGYENLLPEMISYSENNLFKKENDKKVLSIWVTDKENEKIKLLEKAGYQKIHSEPVAVFPYEKPFPERDLPKGFSVLSLEDECDLGKIHDCIWYGFDHGPDPDPEEFDERTMTKNGPNFRKDITTIIKAPNGKYVCFAGMYMDEQNKYAYLEPLATVPVCLRFAALWRIGIRNVMRNWR